MSQRHGHFVPAIFSVNVSFVSFCNIALLKAWAVFHSARVWHLAICLATELLEYF